MGSYLHNKSVQISAKHIKKDRAFSVLFLYLKIENILKFLVKRDADDERELGGGVKLPCLDRADGVSRDTDHIRELLLGNVLLKPYRLEIVLKYKLIVHILPQRYNAKCYCKKHSDSKCNYAGDKMIAFLKFGV